MNNLKINTTNLYTLNQKIKEEIFRIMQKAKNTNILNITTLNIQTSC